MRGKAIPPCDLAITHKRGLWGSKVAFTPYIIYRGAMPPKNPEKILTTQPETETTD